MDFQLLLCPYLPAPNESDFMSCQASAAQHFRKLHCAKQIPDILLMLWGFPKQLCTADSAGTVPPAPSSLLMLWFSLPACPHLVSRKYF